MKIFFTCLSILVFAGVFASAQSSLTVTGTSFNAGTVTRRTVRFNFITRDSINLPLNSDFDMIEDSCSQIIRYTHLNLRRHILTGAFKDVDRLNPQLVLTEGSYNADGLKEGYFISHYLNGNFQAKGSFKNNNYDGKWEIFYQDGKPKVTFEASNAGLTIIDAWDEKGIKTVINVRGAYRADNGGIYWKGKLLDGKPDGTWKAIGADDATETALATEHFKNGNFQKGNSSRMGDYNDASRIALIAPNALPFTRTEKLLLSSVPCNGVKRKHIVNAQFYNGLSAFSEYIKDLVTPFLSKLDLKSYEDQLTVEGEINENGHVLNMIARTAFNEEIARGLISKLRNLPLLEPATADGKPVKQKFTITFKFTRGFYSFSYRFLPIVLN